MWNDVEARKALAEVLELSPPNLVSIGFASQVASRIVDLDQIDAVARWIFKQCLTLCRESNE